MATKEKSHTTDTPTQDTNTTDTQGTVDMDALMATMRAELRAELKAELKAEMQAEKEAAWKVESTPMTAEQIKYWDELVDYDAPFIEGAEEEITVGHNGTLYKIKRGESVKIPRKVKQVLLDSEKQKRDFAKLKKGLKNQELQA